MKNLGLIFIFLIINYVAGALDKIHEETNDDTSILSKTTARTADGVKPRPRSEIDLETEKQVTICAGQNHSIECVSPGSSISIAQTFWGRLSDKICPSEDGDPVVNCGNAPESSQIVRNLCDGKTSCQLSARHTMLQMPGTSHCPGVNKYLLLNYTCMARKKKFVLCEGESTRLRCGPHWKLNILSVFWGRSAASTCPAPLGNYLTCSSSDVSLHAVKRFCHAKEACDVTASDWFMTRGRVHCPGVDKYAIVTYRCQPNVGIDGMSNETLLDNVTNIDGDTVRVMLQYLKSQQAPINVNTIKLQDAKGNFTLPVPQYKEQVNVSSKKLGALFDYLDSGGENENFKAPSSGKIPVPQDIDNRKNLNYANPLPEMNNQRNLHNNITENLNEGSGPALQNSDAHKLLDVGGNTNGLTSAKQSVAAFSDQIYNPVLRNKNAFQLQTNPALIQTVNNTASSFNHSPMFNGLSASNFVSQTPVRFSAPIGSNNVKQSPMSNNVNHSPMFNGLSASNLVSQPPLRFPPLGSNNVPGQNIYNQQITKPQMLSSNVRNNHSSINNGNLFSSAGLQNTETQRILTQNRLTEQANPSQSRPTENSINFSQSTNQLGLNRNALLVSPKPMSEVSSYVSAHSPSNVQDGSSMERWASLLKEVNNALGEKESLLQTHTLSRNGKAKLLSEKASLLEKISKALDIVSSRLDDAEMAEREEKAKQIKMNRKPKTNKQKDEFDNANFNEKEVDSLQKQVNAAILAAEKSNDVKPSLSADTRGLSAFVPFNSAGKADVSAKSRGIIQVLKGKKLKITRFQEMFNKFVDQQKKSNKTKQKEKNNGTLSVKPEENIVPSFGESYKTSNNKTQKPPMEPFRTTNLSSDKNFESTSAESYTSPTGGKLIFGNKIQEMSAPRRKQAPKGRVVGSSLPRSKTNTVKVSPKNVNDSVTLNEISKQLDLLANKTNRKERGTLTSIINNIISIIDGKQKEFVESSAAQRTILLKPQSTVFPVKGAIIGGTINNEISSGSESTNDLLEKEISDLENTKLINKSNSFKNAVGLQSVVEIGKSPFNQEMKIADYQNTSTEKPSNLLISHQELKTKNGDKKNLPDTSSTTLELLPKANPKIQSILKPNITEGLVVNLSNEHLKDISKYLEISPDRKHLQLKSSDGGQTLLSKLRQKEIKDDKENIQNNRLVTRLPNRIHAKINGNPEVVTLEQALTTDIKGTSFAKLKDQNKEHDFSLLTLPFNEKQGNTRNSGGKTEGTITNAPFILEQHPKVSFGSDDATVGKINSALNDVALNLKAGVKHKPLVSQAELQGKLTLPSETQDGHIEAPFSTMTTFDSSELKGIMVNNTTNQSAAPPVLQMGSNTSSELTKGLKPFLTTNDDEIKSHNSSEFISKKNNDTVVEKQQDIQNATESENKNDLSIDSIVQQVINGLKTRLMEDEKKNGGANYSKNLTLKKDDDQSTAKKFPGFDVIEDPLLSQNKGQYAANGGLSPEDYSQPYDRYSSYELPNSPYIETSYPNNPYSEGYVGKVSADEIPFNPMNSVNTPNDKTNYSEDSIEKTYPFSKDISVPDDPIMNALKNIERNQDNLEAAKLEAIQKHNKIEKYKNFEVNKKYKNKSVKLNNINRYKGKKSDALFYFNHGKKRRNKYGAQRTKLKQETSWPKTIN